MVFLGNTNLLALHIWVPDPAFSGAGQFVNTVKEINFVKRSG